MTERRLVGGFLGVVMMAALVPAVAWSANICGSLGEPCCSGENCFGVDLTCVNNECVTCGGAGQPCCLAADDVIGAGQERETTCNPGLFCKNGTCTHTTAPALSLHSLAAAGVLLLGAGVYRARRRRAG